jgi:hypothetical protein
MESQRSAGADTALVIVDERLGSPPPSDFLLGVHRLQPQAKRILLIEQGNWSSGHPVISAMALGQVDYHLFNPWSPLERILYPSLSEFLAAWDTTRMRTPYPSASSASVVPHGHMKCATC